MTQESKSIAVKIVVGVAVVCVLVCVALIVLFLWWSSGFDSSYGLNISKAKDQDLIAIFQSHSDLFDKLQQIESAGVQREPPGHEESPNPARLQLYSNLVSQIHSDFIIGPDYDGTVRFIFAGEGSAISPDWGKGLEYVPGDYEAKGAIYSASGQWKGLTLTNLDNASSLPANVYLREIKSNWFVFYQRDE